MANINNYNLSYKPLYIYTENLNFFYKLNKELKRLNIDFEILYTGRKLPTLSSIVLTTLDEIKKLENIPEKLVILPYSSTDNFNHYILEILAAVKIEFKDFYSELTFSIDPGTTHIGIIVFLDDFYLHAHTIYEKELFIETINKYIICFQKKNLNLLRLNFKIGSGVIPITIDLLKKIFSNFENRKKMKVYLVDEAKSSKIKIQDKFNLIKSKHESSALIIAMRKGIEVNIRNYLKVIKYGNSYNQNYYGKDEISFEPIMEGSVKLKEIISRLLNDDISLSKSSQILEEYNSNSFDI
ncbi:hypothetical protein LCGC14_0783660 [marine sediment metagenome]|uniref:Uncharacterized protein n=1 Tax=marine sediment metagenome TaxID=412755 RepID=A0A0F9T1R0_9ZZZZ